jgi:hypothetical protein
MFVMPAVFLLLRSRNARGEREASTAEVRRLEHAEAVT